MLWCMDVKFCLQKNQFYYNDLPFHLRDKSLLNKAIKNGYISKNKRKNTMLYKLSSAKINKKVNL